MNGGSRNNRAKLIEGPVRRQLIKLTLPMVFGIVGVIAFNLVDTFFIGMLGTKELAAFSFTFPVVFIFGGISLGLGTGAAALISRAIGEGDESKIKRLTTDSLVLALLVVAAFVTLGFLSIGPVFRAMGASEETQRLIRSYMVYWYPGMLFIVIPMVGNSAIRATGDTKSPAIIMLTAVLVNIILDPLLIFGIGPFPRLELSGAAIATNIARATTLFLSLWLLHRKYKMLTLVPPSIHEVLESWKRILYIGLPSATSAIIVPVGMAIITRMVASYGETAVAAFGVASRLEAFALTVLMALSSVLAPFVGQNLGAGRQDRIEEGVKESKRFAMLWGVTVLVLLAVAAKSIAPLFSDNPAVIRLIVDYLWLVPVSYGLMGVLMLSSSTLNVLHKPLHATSLHVLYMFVLFIPFAYTGSQFFGVLGIFGGSAAAKIFAGLAANYWLTRQLTQEEAKLAVVPSEV